MLLVELHLEELIEQRREPEGFYPEKLRGDSRIEDAIDLPAIVLMEQAKVVVGVMKNDLDLRILEYLTEAGRHSDRQRVDDRALVARRDLQEIYPVDEPVKARSFGIDGYLSDSRDIVEEVVCFLLRIDVDESFLFPRCHLPNLAS